jgi:ubiquinone/menaquinone biosynthesis C-methylase UbiE
MKLRVNILSLLNYFPQFKKILRIVRDYLFKLIGISSQYIVLQGENIKTESFRLKNSWKNDVVPQRQRVHVEHQLGLYKKGNRVDVFDVFVRALRALPKQCSGSSLLEVGCSSGYYFEVIELAGLHIRYSGCDYSSSFIKMAREKYPSIDFEVEDASDLSYADESFDIVVSGCCLLHIPGYSVAVAEAARVARRYVLFHRTPVVWGQTEQFYYKKAYGIETIEIHFNESEFLSLLSRNSLELIATYTLSENCSDHEGKQGQAIRTYVCRKKINDNS